MTNDVFRDRVSAYRRANGRSQDELAAALGLNPKVLSRKLNATGAARLTHPEIKHLIKTLAEWHAITSREQVFELLALQHMPRSAFSEAEWASQPLSRLEPDQPAQPAAPPKVPPPASLPARGLLPAPTTRLIGRDWAVERVRLLIDRADVRLVTLVGTGGTGKTRLACEVASGLAPSFAHGVMFVSLADLADPALVSPAIAHTLGMVETGGVSPLEWLQSHLRGRHMLLLLDNFEHVLGAAEVVAALLAAAPHLKVLVTSRASLRLSGEWEFGVPPLDLPDRQHLPMSVEQLAQYGAAQLFIERAKAVQPDLAITEASAPLIGAICIRLDGLPLAIELAAARMRLLTIPTLHHQLEQTWRTLLSGSTRDRPSRQQTLWNTMTWSFLLLEPELQQLFARLGVFVGGWTIEAVEAVCYSGETGPLDSFEALDMLLGQSLIRQVPGVGGDPRFSMLETIRAYALERLAASDMVTTLRQAHLRYFVALAEHAETQLRGREQQLWLERLDLEYANIHAALTWGLGEENDLELGGRLAAALWQFWRLRGRAREGHVWLEKALARRSELSSRVQARALCHAAYLAWRQGAYERTGALSSAALEICRQTGDMDSSAWSHGLLGCATKIEGNYEQAEAYLAESQRLFAASGNTWGQAWALGEIGHVGLDSGNTARAEQTWTESLRLFQALGDTQAFASALDNLGRLAWWVGDAGLARARWEESLALFRQLGDSQGQAWVLNSLGDLARWQGDSQHAERCYSESLTLLDALGDVQGRAAVRHNLGYILLARGEYRQAMMCFIESLTVFRDLSHPASMADCLTGGACVALVAGQPELATQLLGAVTAHRTAIDSDAPFVTPANREAWERNLATARQMLGEQAFARNWQRGQAMNLQEATVRLLEQRAVWGAMAEPRSS